jgi:hypothetical protein
MPSIAWADDVCPAPQTFVCPESPDQTNNTSCVKPGATFVQQGNTWKPVDELKISHPNTNKLNLLYVVDSDRTKRPFGLVYVGVMRTRSISVTSKNVRLSRNIGSDMPDNSELLESYNKAVNLRGPVTTPLYNWEKIPDTDFIFTAADRLN